jgi:hypothetical protein
MKFMIFVKSNPKLEASIAAMSESETCLLSKSLF